MPGVATETHPLRNGYPCSQFYGPGNNLRYFAPINPYRTSSTSTSFDEPDNNTNKSNDLLPVYNLKPIYTMNDIFHREDERLKTFDNWPLEWMDKVQLAQTGMFYTGEMDKVKCYFCEVEIGRWEHDDQPVPEHMRWSANCPLLRRRTTNNVPISADALDRLLPPVSYDICGANDTIEVRPRAYPEGTISRPTHYGPPGSSNCATSTPTYFPDYPEYAIEQARIRSFAEWPRLMKQKPEQLAEAGFFYTGIGDRVKCFSCGGGLKDWDEGDDPWEQHARWLSKCAFLKLIKGPIYIDAIKAKQKSKEEMEKLTPAVVEQIVSLEAEKPMDTVAAAAAAVDPVCTAASSTASTASVCAEKKSHSSIPEEKLCKICYVDEYNTAFLPCGHVVACAKCASSVTKCPLCRKSFTDVMRVYFS